MDFLSEVGIRISAEEAVAAVQIPTLESLNRLYFAAQDPLSKLASTHQGSWDLSEGFIHDGCDPRSSASVQRYSQNESPFTNYMRKELIPNILAETELIGLSVTVSSQLVPAFELCRELRGYGYRGLIILGGNLVTRLQVEMCTATWIWDLIDGFVTFQGEIALLQLATKPRSQFGSVPNLTWRPTDTPVTNPARPLVPAQFGAPEFSEVDLKSYWGIPYLPLLGVRGCYYGKCNFCAIPLAWGSNGYIGADSPSRILDQAISIARNSGVNRFKFVEEAMHPEFLRRFSRSILEANFRCEFEGYCRLDPFLCDRPLLATLSKTGLRKVYIGLELSPSANRERLGKSDRAPVGEALRNLASVGIKTHLFCLFGYPGTGADDAHRTVEFLIDYEEMIDTVDIFSFYYAKGTRVPDVLPLPDQQIDWAVEYPYRPTKGGVLTENQATELAARAEDILWDFRPSWLHPVYRLVSPWTDCSC